MINVVFDTNFYRSQKYCWESQKIKSIKRLCNEGYMKVYVPEIVDREIKRHLLSAGKESYVRLKKLIKDYPSIMPATHEYFNQAFLALESCKIANETENRLIKDYEDFKESISAVVIPINYKKAESIVNNYFSTAPPFEKKQDKKNEFPDAFALESIKSYFSGDFVVVVSEDNGWELFLISAGAIMPPWSDRIPRLRRSESVPAKAFHSICW
ncbi:MAG: PIN domain-containing protein [Solidesulfovibrio sp. DCME]|uniref:PIN domain-containing protein n=1 Tax=Solidesulfovibrio sp. DCME TaxID=3447380 RepID=UPI003D1508A4